MLRYPTRARSMLDNAERGSLLLNRRVERRSANDGILLLRGALRFGCDVRSGRGSAAVLEHPDVDVPRRSSLRVAGPAASQLPLLLDFPATLACRVMSLQCPTGRRRGGCRRCESHGRWTLSFLVRPSMASVRRSTWPCYCSREKPHYATILPLSGVTTKPVRITY